MRSDVVVLPDPSIDDDLSLLGRGANVARTVRMAIEFVETTSAYESGGREFESSPVRQLYQCVTHSHHSY